MDKKFENSRRAMRHILDKAYEMLGNPLVMIDTSYNLIAHSENPVQDDPVWNELLARSSFSHETVDFFNRADFILAVAESDVVALLKSDLLKYDRACGKFFDKDGIQLGEIAVVACLKPFETKDFETIISICEWIGAELAQIDSPEITEQFFSDASFIGLMEEDAPLSARQELAAQFRGELRQYLFVAVADTSQYERTSSHLAYFRDVFAKIRGDFHYFVHLNNIVILMGSDRPFLRIQTDMIGLNEFFGKYDIYAGVSNSFQNLLDIKEHYRQAIIALNRGLDQRGKRNIFQYEPLSADSILNAMDDSYDLLELCNPIALQISEFDKDNSSDYLGLLHTYLRTGKSKKRTCEQTGFSPENFNQWLKNMSKRFDIDWSDGDQLFSLLISIKILKRM